MLLDVDASSLNAGMMGYNGVLCAIAMGGVAWQSCIWAVCSVVLSTVLQIIGINSGVITLTAPFVVSVWIMMGVQNLIGTMESCR